MEYIVSFINSMNRVEFYCDIVNVVDKNGKKHSYTKEDFWGRIIPAWANRVKKEQA